MHCSRVFMDIAYCCFFGASIVLYVRLLYCMFSNWAFLQLGALLAL